MGRLGLHAAVLVLALALPSTAYDRSEHLQREREMNAAYIAGDFKTAEALARRLFDEASVSFGATSAEALLSAIALANALDMQGSGGAAVDVLRAAHGSAQGLDPLDPLRLRVTMALGVTLGEWGAPEEGLTLVAEAAEQGTKLWGAEDPTVVVWRYNLAGMLEELFYLDDALAVYVETLPRLRALPGEGKNAAIVARQIARLQAKLGDRRAAASAYRAALADFRAVFGPDDPRTADTLVEYGMALWRNGEQQELGPVVDEATPMVERIFGADSLRMAELREVRALLWTSGGPQSPSFAKGLDEQRAALAIKRKLLGSTNTATGESALDLAAMVLDIGEVAEAYALVREAEGAGLSSRDYLYWTNTLLRESGGQSALDEAAEALRIAQATGWSAAAQSSWIQGTRAALGDRPEAALYRELTDLDEEQLLAQQDLARLAALPKAESRPDDVTTLRQRLAEIAVRMDALNQSLSELAPDLADLIQNSDLPLPMVQAALRDDEALVVIDLGHTEGAQHVLTVVTNQDAMTAELKWTTSSFTETVAALRLAVSDRLGTRAGVALKPKTTPESAEFPLEDAAWLYQETLGQAEDLIAGKSHLYILPRGAMATLPPALLLTEDYAGDMGAAPWLIRRHAITVLPSVAALTRRDVAGAAGAEALVLANPTYSGDLADLPPLPETESEGRAVLSRHVGQLLSRDGASEAALKTADLGATGLLYLATHGLMAGDQLGEVTLDEPALALSGGDGEDGLLTASEILPLRLAQTLVVLSACNTAAGSGSDSEALAGLASAFLYAGAEGLLVSHWPVESRSAVALMSDIFAKLAADPTRNVAQAERQAILDMLAKPGDPKWVHPAYWAPFITVGAVPARAAD